MQPPAMQIAQQPVHAFLGHRAQREGTAGNTDIADTADSRSPAEGMFAFGTRSVALKSYREWQLW